MSEGAPRYSRRPIPAQRYLPGRTPRPRELAPPRPSSEPARWWEGEGFLHGVDLWNRAFFWEAHEAWEAPWRAAGRRNGAARPLQGLILLAAAAVKHELGAHEAARRMAARGAIKLRESGAVQTLDLAAFANGVEAWVRGETPTSPMIRLDAMGH